jgi:farnesyl diphosphate synthase
MAAPPAKRARDERHDFHETWESVHQDILKAIDETKLPSFVRQYAEKMFQYNVPGGKLNRGSAVLQCLRALQPKEAVLSAEMEKLAVVAGWCIELLQACFLVSDDVMDNSITRRGQPCWYRVPNIGNKAINDSLVLESAIYILLKQHFRSHPRYLDLVELFHKVSFQTQIGQLMDLETMPEGMLDLNLFTEERYTNIVVYKTAFYSFYLPVATGMLIADVKSEQAFVDAERICIEMGTYFQIQDDYLDCYGCPEVIGKIGTDIKDAKCCWLVVQALKLATPDQRQVIENHYGRDSDEDEKIIKKLYVDMGLEQLYRDYEKSSFESITTTLDTLQSMPRGPFDYLLGKIYKRSK